MLGSVEIQASNQITDTPTLQLIASGPLIIDSDAILETISSSGFGTEIDPYIIEGFNITDTFDNHGIFITQTSKYFVVQNNIISAGRTNNVHGIYIDGIAANTALIRNNEIMNSDIGILVSEGLNSTVKSNVIHDSLSFGIAMADGTENSVIVSNSIIYPRKAGINLEGADSLVENNQIIMSVDEAVFNYGIGIHRDNIQTINNSVIGSMEGINVSPISNVRVENNRINGAANGITGWPSDSLIINNIVTNGSSMGDGIRLQGETSTWKSVNNVITMNLVQNFPSYGFYAMGNSNNNSVVHNVFLSNNYERIDEVQAFDVGSGNLFDSNYWNDWTNPDQDKDDFVDMPYQIDGLSFSEDPHPHATMGFYLTGVIQHTELTDINQLEVTDDDNLLSQTLVLNPLILISAFMVVLAIPVIKMIQTVTNNGVTKLITGTLTDMIGFAPPFLIGVINSNQDNTEEFHELVPTELISYKFLLNPIKLSIIKMLHTYSSYPAYMVREILQISWGKFSSHVNSLIDKGYIRAQEEFYEGSPTKILRIEFLGTTKYQELREILKKMFEIIEN